jgi:hypothetical protein
MINRKPSSWMTQVTRSTLVDSCDQVTWIIHSGGFVIIGHSVQDPRFESRSYPITLHVSPEVHQFSSTGLSKAEWCVDSLWFMHLKDPLGSFEKRRGISSVPSLQFWLRSQSLGFDGTQSQWYTWSSMSEAEKKNRLISTPSQQHEQGAAGQLV